jgi:hypothetical protein
MSLGWEDGLAPAFGYGVSLAFIGWYWARFKKGRGQAHLPNPETFNLERLVKICANLFAST